MSKTRGKRPGLRARSKNARAKVDPGERVRFTATPPPAPAMYFNQVGSAVPEEGSRVLVRLKDDTYRFGMVMSGRFAGYDHHGEHYVTMPHADRITHWMVIVPPVDLDTAHAEAESPQAQESTPQTIEEAILAAAVAPGRAEDVYA